jgi:hypothetical protein
MVIAPNSGRHNKSLDASGGSASRNLLSAAEVASCAPPRQLKRWVASHLFQKMLFDDIEKGGDGHGN